MGIGSRRAVTGAATALLLFFATAGAATAEEGPSDDTTISADQTTDINDRQGWEDEPEQPVLEKTPYYCDGPGGQYSWYSITSKKNYFIPSWWNGTKYKDGPGGTMNVSVTKAGTISVDVTGTIEFQTNAIIAKAKTSVSVHVGGSTTITTGHNYSHNISRNKYGHLQYGSWGYKVTWKKLQRVGSCGVKELGHGTATLPTSETGWKYWETSS
ncbi:hypothetical protein ACFYW9_09395 [Streptomyces sp. NPDC002698]|uniref:hypothetical protein n=1 Tax=Streptomyces sp. NPDC002698 TaxID=3364660 RepID=UPI0036C4E798